MRILILSERFLPEIAAPSFRIHQHAKLWQADGHEVTVLTSAPNLPYGKVFDGYRNWPPYQVEIFDGIKVIRVATYITANEGIFRRSLDHLSLAASVSLMAWKFPPFDIIIASSPPLFTALAGYFLARLRRRHWVFEVRDLWPASIEAIGAYRGRGIRILEHLELFLYRKSSSIITLTNSFRNNLISRGVAQDKVHVVTNGVDTEQFNPNVSVFDARAKLGISKNVFLAAYVGTVGLAHGLETIVEAANLLRNNRKIHFLIMGDGADRQRIENMIRDLQLENVTLSNFAPHSDMPSYLSAIDLAIVHLKKTDLFKTVIPSKIFECMAMGTPILMAVEGESAKIVTESHGGECIPSSNPQIMSERIEFFSKNPEFVRNLKGAAVDFVRGKYSREACARKALLVFDQLVGNKASLKHSQNVYNLPKTHALGSGNHPIEFLDSHLSSRKSVNSQHDFRYGHEQNLEIKQK